mmetsp:Transcript_107899/g.186057  ORF Transcript_107899/g.186057 Transcript_107899/m.186057 type:complete len:88 (+) Transcript_107899:2264-2527(+)
MLWCIARTTIMGYKTWIAGCKLVDGSFGTFFVIHCRHINDPDVINTFTSIIRMRDHHGSISRGTFANSYHCASITQKWGPKYKEPQY